jgi:hypothetical protein
MAEFSLRHAGYVVAASFAPERGGYAWTAMVLHGAEIVGQWNGTIAFGQIDNRSPEEALSEILLDRLADMPK